MNQSNGLDQPEMGRKVLGLLCFYFHMYEPMVQEDAILLSLLSLLKVLLESYASLQQHRRSHTFQNLLLSFRSLLIRVPLLISLPLQVVIRAVIRVAIHRRLLLLQLEEVWVEPQVVQAHLDSQDQSL